jgi:uncharacterized hydrophobic protein (TIGR00271 family)
MPRKRIHDQHILNVRTSDRYRTVEELFDRSQPSSLYYTLLILSVVIIASGLLLNNAPIIIGGMLVAPVLTPLLLLGLSVIVGEVSSLRRSLMLIAKSALIIAGISLVMGVVFGRPAEITIFEDTMKSAILYFIVAIASGIAATFAWARKEVAEILPGIAISVSLVPPLSLLGIALSGLDPDLSRAMLLIFLFNFIGIVLGSMIVFSLLKFYKAEQKVHKESELESHA